VNQFQNTAGKLTVIEKIISGGQTGADQGALDIALKLDIDHGGWIPRGRKTEAGPLPDKYRLQEMPTGEYHKRTEKNVASAEATVIFSHGPLTGGSLLTQQVAIRHGRPWLHVDLETLPAFEASRTINDWIKEYDIRVLNVAGPRASQDPHIYKATADILESAYYLSLVQMPGRETASGLAGVPESVDQAVDMMVAQLPLKDRTAVANLQKNQLENLLQAVDIYLSGEFALGRGNDLLMASCSRYLNEELEGQNEPAMAVINELWKRLRGTHRLRIVK
jgi:hypothetical protein